MFSFPRQLTTWHCPHLLLSAVLRRGCCWPPAHRPCSKRSIPPGSRAHSSKPTATACGGLDGLTDGWTDRRADGQIHRSCYNASSANKSVSLSQGRTTRYVSNSTRLTALFPGLPGWADTRKVKPIWILLKQETVSGSGISMSATRSRQITTPVPHRSLFYRPDALPAAQTTASKQWRQVSKYE